MALLDETAHVCARLYEVAGRSIALETAEEWCDRMAATFLSNFFLEEKKRTDGRVPDIIVRFSAGDPPPAPVGLETIPIRQGICRTDGETYDLTVNDTRIRLGSLAEKRIDVWMGRTEQARKATARVNVMAYVLHLALRRCSLYDLHSAGVVEPSSGAGVLFVGESNSGKSSLTVRLARAGWPYLSDDFLLLYDAGNDLLAKGLRRPFSVSASSLANCDLPRLEEALGDPVNSDPTKRRLDPSIAFPGGFAERCRPSVLFFPLVTGEAISRVEPLSRTEVLARLLGLCPWSTFDVTGQGYVNFLGRLSKQVRGYILHAGTDLIADPEFAASFVSPHVQA